MVEEHRTYGLIGYPLSHSFSKQYFTEKFRKEGIKNSVYELFELESIQQLSNLFTRHPSLRGLNVTIPYKQQVLAYVDQLDPIAERIGAVNTIRIREGKKAGFNSDYYGFRDSLLPWLAGVPISQALVLGTGGASKAIACVLQDLDINYTYVSRQPKGEAISYENLKEHDLQKYPLIVNTTPLGMSPQIETLPDLPYERLTADHYCYDLVYNPEKTAFMEKASQSGAHVKNGLEMLYLQAEKSWEFWNRSSS